MRYHLYYLLIFIIQIAPMLSAQSSIEGEKKISDPFSDFKGKDLEKSSQEVPDPFSPLEIEEREFELLRVAPKQYTTPYPFSLTTFTINEAKFSPPSLKNYMLWLGLETNMAFFIQIEGVAFYPYIKFDLLWNNVGLTTSGGYMMLYEGGDPEGKIFHTIGFRIGAKYVFNLFREIKNWFLSASIQGGYIVKNCPELLFSVGQRVRLKDKNIAIEANFSTMIWFLETLYLVDFNISIGILFGII